MRATCALRTEPRSPTTSTSPTKPSPSIYGLHLTEPGGELWRERLAFRDALRLDEALAREYEALKLTLAEQHNAGVVEYTAGKRAFVTRVLEAEGIELQRV